jgi:hypothetical protein
MVLLALISSDGVALRWLRLQRTWNRPWGVAGVGVHAPRCPALPCPALSSLLSLKPHHMPTSQAPVSRNSFVIATSAHELIAVPPGTAHATCVR